MAIQGVEWIVVAAVVLILFLWGPDKLPKIAKSIGQAKREFEKAQKGLEEEMAKAAASPSTPPDDKLLEVARALNISTEGKTRDQIAREIVEKSQKAA
ncbi:MAG: twin-arginine translocase TatA/TatE family subunit [Candidatus Caldarchaeum sp.]